ncbi:Aminoacyl-transfer RNA synthetases class-II family profile domain-containing protein [[Candida] zeylanoides]
MSRFVRALPAWRVYARYLTVPPVPPPAPPPPRAAAPLPAEILPRFTFPDATTDIRSVTESLASALGTRVTLHGHLHRKPRKMSVNTFGELRDESGLVAQITMTPTATAAPLFGALRAGTPEDAVAVTGTVQLKRPSASAAPPSVVPWELVVDDYQVLNKANAAASQLDKLKHTSPAQLPPHLRYLQLRTAVLQRGLRQRARAAAVVRRTLERLAFVEIETPLLFKSTPEGAREFLVPTRTRGEFYALPQSPQQYKQILMSSGFTRYYQIAKCFRDEDLRADRQPEFTQVDLEMSFVSRSEQVQAVVESVVASVWREVAGKELYTMGQGGELVPAAAAASGGGGGSGGLAFSRLSYRDAMCKFGIDKPDLRSSLEFVDLDRFFVGDERYPVVQACVLRGAAERGVPAALKKAHHYTGRRPILVAIDSAAALDWADRLLAKGALTATPQYDAAELARALPVQSGDVVAVATREELPYENPTPLGRVRQLAIEHFPQRWRRAVAGGAPSGDVFVANWVVDFPLFTPNADTGALESTHHPFTMVKPQDYELLASAPLSARGEHYDLVVNGVEVGGGSRRIHDPRLQRYVLEELLRVANHRELFGHLLDALSMGCPPHAGLALGFDRMCALLVGSTTIRDVIAFPKNQAGADPMVESPTAIAQARLDDYHITTTE